jgi:acyl carrier protein
MAQQDEAEVRQWCCQYVAGVLKQSVDRVPEDAEFASLGMDSAELLFMVAALEERFGLDLASDTTFEYPSAASLAPFIVAELAAKHRHP